MIYALACLAFFFIQAPQTPPKPASIEGFVRRVETGEPVFKARVVLSGSPTAPAGNNPGGMGVQKTFTTDKYGHFEFTDLPAGRYTLTAFANSYVRLVYGQKAQNLPATPIVLTAGQQVKDLLFEMTPTSTISGRIYDFDNMPMPGADVFLQKPAYDQNGQKMLQTIQQVRTNDLGEYRLYWITPGKYFVRVDYSGVPTPLFRSPNEFVGPLEDGYSSTYYPGTSDVSSASPIELLPGAQLSAIDLQLIRTKTYTVKGRAIITNPLPNQRPFVSMRPRQQTGIVNTSMNPMTYMDGTFEIHNVLPGSYILSANAGNGGTLNMPLRAEQALEVTGDMEGVIITLSPGFEVPFRLVFETPPPVTGSNPNPLSNLHPALRTFSTDFGSVITAAMMNGTTVKPDGTFTIANVIPGTYQLMLAPLPSPDWYIKAISFGSTDGFRDGLALEHTPESPIEVVLSPNAGSIKGTVVDRDAKLVPNTRVILIPAERTRTERFKFAVTDPNGAFTMRGIYPGSYKLFAWDMIEPNAERDPDFVRQYEEQGKSAPIAEGANPSVELRLIKVVP